MEPLISIIVPVYNIREYLPRCVRSLMEQTYRNLEILLVDDGSTDGTGQLCDDLAKQDKRIRVFHKENGGTSTARNLGIREAKGEYLGFVDSDDYVDSDMYERLMRAIAKYGVKAVQVGRDEVDAEGNALPDICVPPEEAGILSTIDFLRELLLHRGDCSFCTKLIRRDCFMGLGFPEGALNEDFRLLIEMLPGMGPLVSLPGHAYHVFYRLGSNTRKESREVFSRVYGDCVDNADMVLKLIGGGYLEALKEADSPEEAAGTDRVEDAERTEPGSEAAEAESVHEDLLKAAYRFGVFQRLEYLLHIPISQMTAENEQYREIVRWLRKYLWKAMGNPYLTLKNKAYHVLFAAAPRGVRVVHRRLKGL